MDLSTVKSGRIEIIDVLRGVSLLGIILVHFVEQSYAAGAPEKVGAYNIKNNVDLVSTLFVGMFISGKFFMIFSFLFGLSFYLQLYRETPGRISPVRFAWRLVILFAIGFLHNLHYQGDILTIYAMLGFGLLLFCRLPDKWVAIAALLLIADLPTFVAHGIDALQLFKAQQPAYPSPGADDAQRVAYWSALKYGSYADIIQANYREFSGKIRYQLDSGRLYTTLGSFLMGYIAGRKKLFEQLSDHIFLGKKCMRYALWTALSCLLFSAAFLGSLALLEKDLPRAVDRLMGGLIRDVFDAAMATIYMSGIILIFQKEKWQKHLRHFRAVGRMSLTTYLMQTLIGIFLFFGIGLNWLGEIGATACIPIGIAVFLVQIQFSKVWLQRFRYGLFEWLWRSLTYLKMMPFII